MTPLGYLLPATYQVDTILFGGALDDLGTGQGGYGAWWIPSKTTGWHGAAKPRTFRTPRPYAHGAFRSPNYRAERIITIQGSCQTSDVGARLLAEDKLNALCGDSGKLYDFVGSDQLGRQRLAAVELADAPQVAVMGEHRFDFSIQFAAPDPRKHDYQIQAPIAGPPTTSAAGLDFTSPGLNFTAPGLDFGTPPQPQPVSVGNYGTAPAYPIIQITGPATTPVVQNTTSGYQFVYSGELDVGETLTINCDTFPREGYPPRRAISSVHGDVRNDLTLTGWPSVDPGALETFTLLSSATPTSQLSVILRSAWW